MTATASPQARRQIGTSLHRASVSFTADDLDRMERLKHLLRVRSRRGLLTSRPETITEALIALEQKLTRSK